MTDTFGDYEVDDAWDTAPPDPLQVAIRIHRIRRYLGRLGGIDPGDFFDLSAAEQADAVDAADRIVAWMADHPAAERAELARTIHDFRQAIDPGIPPWADLTDDLREVAEAIAEALAEWLMRQGAWR